MSNTLYSYTNNNNINYQYKFDAQIYTYYNQYCASPSVTQQRRILRNYYNNQLSINSSNKNYLINKYKKIYFLYINLNSYMFIQDLITKKIDKYLLINKCWIKCNCKI